MMDSDKKTGASTPPHNNLSPLVLLGFFALAAFLAELVIMVSIDLLNIHGPFSNILDAALLTVLISPALYFIVYKPLSERARSQQLLTKELKNSHEILLTVLDSLDAVVYVTDIKSNEILFLNKFARDIFGECVGKICWQTLQQNQTAPCDFCTNDKLLSENGEAIGLYTWEFRNTINDRWYDIRDRAINWTDGRLARLEIATDITDRKNTEDKREKLIETLKKAYEEVRILQEIVPICSHCKKVRDDEGFWKQVDEYFNRHTGTNFSHSICPECMQSEFPEFDK